LFCYRHPIANQRINSGDIVRALASDSVLLPGTENDKEQPTLLGDPLDTSSQLYFDLQQMYLPDSNS